MNSNGSCIITKFFNPNINKTCNTVRANSVCVQRILVWMMHEFGLRIRILKILTVPENQQVVLDYSCLELNKPRYYHSIWPNEFLLPYPH